jgi:hypothetical protein
LIPLDQSKITSLFEKFRKSLSTPTKKFPDKEVKNELSSGNTGLYLLLLIVNSSNTIKLYANKIEYTAANSKIASTKGIKEFLSQTSLTLNFFDNKI